MSCSLRNALSQKRNLINPHGALQAPVAGKQGAPLRSPLSWRQAAENSQLLSVFESQRSAVTFRKGKLSS